MYARIVDISDEELNIKDKINNQHKSVEKNPRRDYQKTRHLEKRLFCKRQIKCRISNLRRI